MEELRDQPKEKVGDIVQGYIEDGKTHVSVKRQNDGRYTIKAS